MTRDQEEQHPRARRLGALCLAAGIADVLLVNLWLGPRALVAAAPPVAMPAARSTEAATTISATSASAAPTTARSTEAALVEADRATVYFGFDSAVVPQEAQAGLRRLARRQASTTSARIRITGFADGAGGEAYNTAIAEVRARAVAEVLAKLGAAPDRIEAGGGGIAGEAADPALHVRARRAEIVLSSGAGASR
jgi:outer membrane protein OmpA-like peptidoglycan-associated protein